MDTMSDYLCPDMQMRKPSGRQLPKATESYCFYLSFSVVIKLGMKSQLTHSVLPPTLLLSFNYVKAVERKAAVARTV